MQKVLVWDKFIRLFHWSIASVFILNSFLLEDDIHEYLGYGLFGLLVARVIWGFIGPFNARFSSFFPSRARVQHHIHAIKTHSVPMKEGHNALGGMMIIFLLTLLFIISLSGWLMTLDQFWGEDWPEDLHELAANIALVAVGVHVCAVIVMSKVTDRNLIKTMITGYRNKD
jgi:cytochrome b